MLAARLCCGHDVLRRRHPKHVFSKWARLFSAYDTADLCSRIASDLLSTGYSEGASSSQNAARPQSNAFLYRRRTHAHRLRSDTPSANTRSSWFFRVAVTRKPTEPSVDSSYTTSPQDATAARGIQRSCRMHPRGSPDRARAQCGVWRSIPAAPRCCAAHPPEAAFCAQRVRRSSQSALQIFELCLAVNKRRLTEPDCGSNISEAEPYRAPLQGNISLEHADWGRWNISLGTYLSSQLDDFLHRGSSPQ